MGGRRLGVALQRLAELLHRTWLVILHRKAGPESIGRFVSRSEGLSPLIKSDCLVAVRLLPPDFGESDQSLAQIGASFQRELIFGGGFDRFLLELQRLSHELV